ncbi:hypothetical protein OIU78_007699 [Salix suchowensis]|nr:hypothetical protein OIU78_007699 [Salix suchowensis]
MAMSGFEGFEKRLELRFCGDDPVTADNNLGLRLLGFESLEQVLDAVQCTVVSAVANQYFDAYVLSESSLFVYPTKIIIKTCTLEEASSSPRHSPSLTPASKKKLSTSRRPFLPISATEKPRSCLPKRPPIPGMSSRLVINLT